LLVKPNETELARWWSQDQMDSFINERELLTAAHRLAEHCSLVCISRGARGLSLVHGRQHWHFQAPKIRARGTVGAGDSLLGAISASLAGSGLLSPHLLERAFSECKPGELPAPLYRAMILGLAAGAATASEPGTSLARPAVIKKLARAAAKLNPAPRYREPRLMARGR
jgi:fructose-1-phosphate kinase PfkB-like protein